MSHYKPSPYALAALKEQIAVEQHTAALCKLLADRDQITALRELAESRMRDEIEASKTSAKAARPLSQILAEIVGRVAAGQQP